MAKTSIARGGDEILRPQSFYGSSPARPAALRTVDAAGNSNVGVNKALTILRSQGTAGKTKKPRDKLPEKPKSAAVLFAEMQADNQALDQSSSFPMFDAKQLRRETRKVVLADSMKDWQDGKISDAIVEEFSKKAEEDKARYAKEVEEWSKQHPDDALVLDDNGIAVKQSKWKESKEEEAKKKEQKRIKRAAKERKEKRSVPVKTPEMLAVGKRAAARIAKMKKTMAKVQYESLSEGSVSAGEVEDSELDEDESSAALSTDDDENEQDGCEANNQVQQENAVPLESTGVQKSVKRQNRQGVKKIMPKCGEGGALETAASKDSEATRQPTPAAAPKVKKRRTRQNSMPDDVHAEATDTLRDTEVLALPKVSSTAANAEGQKKESKTPKQKKGSKRSRQETVHSEQGQRSADLPSNSPTAKASPKKAKNSKQAPEPITSHNDTEVAKVEPNHKRAFKRRSKGAAAKTRQQPRRLSGGSAASQGEYCGEYAFDV